MRKGLPRKMGGFKRATNLVAGIARGLNIYDNTGSTYTHLGWSSGLQRFLLDMNGNVSGIVDRTPVGFAADANNLWQFDLLFDGTTTTTILLANAAPNLSDITNDVQTPVYYGDVLTGTALTATASPNVAGGVFALGPYAVSYDHDGVVNWSTINDVAAAWTTARPTSQKLVFALPIRAGAGNGPSGLIWGIAALLRMTFVGGAAVFNFDQITTGYSLLSSQAVIEYDGIYYWPGIDHFLMYNGVIQEVENGMNLNWFYDNLNYNQVQKVFAFKVPRWGEIWWCYPRGSATECSHAVILNVRLSRILGYMVWYDTELPAGRSAGQYARIFRRPIMTGTDIDSSTSAYKLWEHEFGVDALDGNEVLAIESYFETNELFLAGSDTPQQPGASNKTIACNLVEPDFIQTGDMDLVVKSRWNARSPENVSAPYTFADTAATSAEENLTIRETGRLMRFRFTSNVQGGNYEAGEILAHIQPTDGRMRS